ncbi:MAG: DUF4954 family protein, partial [Spirochaetaceae bacterium]|nr:DUF4954 family protein [Spirochaetaceae bacterium]
FKHNSRFASFTLVAKGSYSYELDIAYPFSLVYMDKKDEAVHVMPAYWFVHNMYAMARNSWKFRKRDARKVKEQNIEVDYLAPDTVSEMLAGMARLEKLAAAEALSRVSGAAGAKTTGAEARRMGRELLSERGNEDAPLIDEGVMRRFGGIVEKPGRGWRHYRDFCAYFGVKTLVDYLKIGTGDSLSSFIAGAIALRAKGIQEKWINLGGQIVASDDVEILRSDLKTGRLDGWDAVHARYDELWAAYPERKARYALYAIEQSLGLSIETMDAKAWESLLKTGSATFSRIYDSAFASRQKDYQDPFRRMVYENEEEMYAVLGKIEDNSFLSELRDQTKAYVELLDSLAEGGAHGAT